MQSSFSSTPSNRYALNGGGPSTSSNRIPSQSSFSTPIQQQTSSNLSEDTSSPLITRNAKNQQQSSLNVTKPRKSAVPDIGTPIKVASSSPYRTPESTSKASLFLSRTPFGTPAARSAPVSTTTSSSAIVKSSITTTQPLKPVTGFWPQVWPLFKSLLDENAYATFALQPRPHLTYSGFIETALRINWVKLLVFSLPIYHALFCISLFRPTNPLQLITLPFRPTAIFLSLTSYAILLGLLLILPGQRFSIASKKWTIQEHAGVRDERLAGGFTLSAGSPASLLVRSLRQTALWRGVMLHAAFALAIATTHALALAHYTSTSSFDGGLKTSNPWSPYHQVAVRLSQGYKTTAIRPNERFWFLLCSNAILGATYAIIRSVLFSRPQISGAGAPAPFAPSRFEAQATFESALVRIATKGRQTIYRAMFVGVTMPSMILQGYLFIRRPFFRVILSLIGHHSPLRPVLVPSFKRPLFNVDLIFRVSLLGLITVLILEAFCVAWEVLATQPIGLGTGGLSKFSSAPTKCLIKGMQSRRIPMPEDAHLGSSERSYYSHFAFAEMATVMATDAERRKAIFRDVGQSNGGNGGSIANSTSSLDSGVGRSAWSVIAGECINVIQEERKWLSNKGKEPITSGMPSASASQKPASHLKPVDAAHQVSLATGNNAVNKAKPSIWDRLASTSPIASQQSATTTPSTTAATSTQVNTNATEGLNSLLHRIAPPPVQSTTTAASSVNGTATGSSISGSNSSTSKITLLDVFVNILVSTFQSLASVFNLLPSDLQHVLRNSIISRKFESGQKWLFSSSDDSLLAIGVLPHDEALVTWSVQILGSLLAASLEQDEYGTVALAASSRLGIDDVLEECAMLLNALQQLGVNVTQKRPDGSNASDTSLFVFDHDVIPLITALRTTITLVLGAFEPTGYRLRPSCRKAVDDALASPKPST